MNLFIQKEKTLFDFMSKIIPMILLILTIIFKILGLISLESFFFACILSLQVLQTDFNKISFMPKEANIFNFILNMLPRILLISTIIFKILGLISLEYYFFACILSLQILQMEKQSSKIKNYLFICIEHKTQVVFLFLGSVS